MTCDFGGPGLGIEAWLLGFGTRVATPPELRRDLLGIEAPKSHTLLPRARRSEVTSHARVS